MYLTILALSALAVVYECSAKEKKNPHAPLVISSKFYTVIKTE